MTYALIGSGNVAWLIASRMLAAGHTCMGVWGRNFSATETLCNTFYLPRLTSLSELNDGPDAVIIAVSDAAISDVASCLSLRHSTLIHTGGSVALSVLDGHSQNVGVVWPVYSIRKDSLPAHRDFTTVIEANNTVALEAVRAVARAISDTNYEANSQQRVWLHLSAVIGNNFVNHLLGIVAEIAGEQQTPLSVLQSLIQQTVTDLQTKSPKETQTGPARRGDEATMHHHMEMLAAHPEWQRVYEAISGSIVSQYKPIGDNKQA